ncbi:exodeoxyribonuclease V subunit alpha [[Mycobacterium] burgundiense]|uniref:RecBCD enzyme subunit RecD n=1 Tax=[Mycobacterium] burgundiense TaxID=3064286 RepID=A0ABM9M5A9_9MYCO|nr:exodeoxyribonuclease V subunit alpha [Mycolicibacterium sp. MU0053]CAJ1510358.1 exodeoxyribonuclease V subunit alpha [Mycolicibacterium sp. MU0053]
MTAPSVTESRDPVDRRLVLGAAGLLRDFNAAGVLEAADVHVAARLAQLCDEDVDETVTLAVALAVRAVRAGSVCVDLTTVAADSGAPELDWPQPAQWVAAVRASPLLATPPVLHLEGEGLLYLDRYWREEEQVCVDLLGRLTSTVPAHGPALAAALDRVFHRSGSDEQRAAAEVAVTQLTTVLTGGPGTGKTTTVAGLLALLTEQAELAGRPALRIALAAPTGKAAARLQEAVELEIGHLVESDRARLTGLQAVTLHRLLGSRPDTSSRFRHHRGNRLPHDVIVVDETSMVSLTMMARLLEAIRPDSRLILVGDPDQLSSVEAGAVLADLVEGLGGQGRVAALTTSHRFGHTIGVLAGAIQRGDADAVLEVLHAGGDHVEFVQTADPVDALREVLMPHALAVRAAAARSSTSALAALDEHRLLCAHREGPHGVRRWNQQVQRWLVEHTGELIWTDWYVGRPVLVTANDYGLGLYNGDTGVTVLADGMLRVAIAGAAGVVDFATSRLAEVETMHAMTIHKSQGSQAGEITVLLPPEDSRLLSRELFYTAVTRAKHKVRVVGTEAEVRAALARRVVRATGLRRRLQQS